MMIHRFPPPALVATPALRGGGVLAVGAALLIAAS